jgi:putative toxin-antitoxin system antitoxin component (TIGR02293 family)
MTTAKMERPRGQTTGVTKKAARIANPINRTSLKATPARTPTSVKDLGVTKGMFARLVIGKPVVGIEAVKAIREGYPATILKSASGYLGVPEARIYKVAHVPSTTANRLKKRGAKIDSGVTERVYRIGSITRMAIEVFEETDTALEWMRQPNRALGNVAPLDLLDTEPGAVLVRQVLNAIATGGVA